MRELYQDEAELIRWLSAGGCTRLTAQPEDVVRRIIAERDAARAEADALKAKLPRYANGEAFVPSCDPCWVWLGGDKSVYGIPVWHSDRGEWSYYNPGYKGHATTGYPTAAACEEAEAKEAR